MGAQSFSLRIRDDNINQAYNYLVDKAIENNGRDPYNGTISTCELGSCKKRFDNYSEKNIKEACRYIESIDYGQKGVANYIDLGAVEYKIIKPVKRTYDNTPKYKLMYIVENSMGNKVESFLTKTQAVNKALELATKNMESYRVTKDYDLIEGNNLLVRCSLEEKTYKTKPKSIPKNCVLKELHEYILFGWAVE